MGLGDGVDVDNINATKMIFLSYAFVFRKILCKFVLVNVKCELRFDFQLPD